ncbi:Putative oligopeptide transporter, OPT superfamily [Septoria linicola]|uniref:Oligopeptide transporter, OPT superfamily n=1 Tax=Septoria linicola TaxID=215465 RepID=A0A9Q9EEQ6_9PEZI|nr:putative oligopeptide transporter, OPT superfamily [Septoria linicola]USW49051.1 Putative oligopeptide transporter, OPT superfamily [Septoria linicola]
MAPDRGDQERLLGDDSENDLEPQDSIATEPIGQEPDADFLARQSEQPQFTIRALVVGVFIGILIGFSNTYFGLQTGWISGMAMPSALIGFAYFKGLRTMSRAIGGSIEQFGFGKDFSEVENVLVQTVAGSVGTMPLGCGFVGVIPALEFLLKDSETPSEAVYHAGLAEGQTATGGIHLSLAKLILWALGLCFFGVMFAVPLRKEVIIREKLKFPSGTATALMIGVLHGGEKTGAEGEAERQAETRRRKSAKSNGNGDEETQGLISESTASAGRHSSEQESITRQGSRTEKQQRDWQKQIRLLTTSFGISGAYTLISYFIPQIHSVPFLGLYMSEKWVWNLNPSPAYVGQGIIMGPATTIHMLLGALLGWAVLSPIAKYKGWASGPVDDWNTGSKGWIVWVSLAIMLADAIVSLGWLILRPAIWYVRSYGPEIYSGVKRKGLKRQFQDLATPIMRGYSPVDLADNPDDHPSKKLAYEKEQEYDAPPEHQIGVKTTLIGLVVALSFCIFAVQYSFAGIISIGLTVLALLLALLLSIMGVRALGETDLNPVSGISKLTQLIFAAVVPSSAKNAVTINLIAGGISEAGALQAGDLLQDLKCGHLLGASPKAQFWGQLIGSGIGAIVSACVYRLYTNVYTIPGGQFQIPTGYVWIFTARLVTGSGLPPKTFEFAVAAAVLWALLTALRIYGQSKKAWWTSYVPGGIAVAVGMYNTPSFTLARTVGGLMAWYWTVWKKREETPMIVLASGLILGEGLLSIVNLGLASGKVPHL